jgi:hypothetical protein
MGVDIFTDRSVARIETVNGRATGVVIEDGTVYRAPVIAANANAKHLYLDLVGEQQLPAEVVREIKAYRTFSTAFKLNIACERPPQWKLLDKIRADGVLGNFDYPTYMHVAPDIDWLERAYDDAKHGWYSARPFMTPVCPTIVDSTLAPAGKHVVNLFGGHAPYTLKGGSWAEEKENFRRTVFDTLEMFAPHFSDDVIAAQVLVAPDIERNRRTAERPYLPGRTRARPAVLPAPDIGLCRLSDPDRRALSLRLLGPSGGRRVRDPGTQCGARDPARSQEQAPGRQGRSFPGLSSPLGSRACLSARIMASSTGDLMRGMRPRFI